MGTGAWCVMLASVTVAVMHVDTASADGPEEPMRDAWAAPRLSAALDLGLGGPLGMLGLEVEVVPIRWASLSLGYGTNRGVTQGFGGSSSYSLAASARGHVPIHARWDIVLGVGASRSNWAVQDHPLGESPYGEASWHQVTWLDFDVAIEHHWRRIAARAYLGRSTVLARHGYSCQDLRGGGGSECPYMMDQPSTTGYLGVALAYSFSL